MKARTDTGGRRLVGCGLALTPYGGAEFARRSGDSSTETPDLLERVLARENLRQAWQRVKANKGAAGIDGVSIADFPDLARAGWSGILAS